MLIEFASSFPVDIRVSWSIIQAFRGPITDLDKKLGRPVGHTQKSLYVHGIGRNREHRCLQSASLRHGAYK